jgi:hypothetical protein
MTDATAQPEAARHTGGRRRTSSSSSPSASISASTPCSAARSGSGPVSMVSLPLARACRAGNAERIVGPRRVERQPAHMGDAAGVPARHSLSSSRCFGRPCRWSWPGPRRRWPQALLSLMLLFRLACRPGAGALARHGWQVIRRGRITAAGTAVSPRQAVYTAARRDGQPPPCQVPDQLLAPARADQQPGRAQPKPRRTLKRAAPMTSSPQREGDGDPRSDPAPRGTGEPLTRRRTPA